MHVIVRCPKCQRQSDAGDLEIGRKFRCACGEVLKVPRIKAKDAVVVRCSSCGAPRSAGSAACSFCNADFTLHERDLDTLCPSCMARIPDRARFCHNCGTPIVVEGRSGASTELPCPACGKERRLSGRSFGKPPVSVLECGSCAGLWLGRETFNLLTERMRERAAPASRLPGGAGRNGRGRAARQRGPLYRRCPQCDRMMARRNFGKRSGVIIDTCPEHGIWFDAGELHALLGWIRKGGQKRSEQLDLAQARDAMRNARISSATKRLDRMAGASGTVRFSTGRRESSPFMDLLDTLLGGWG